MMDGVINHNGLAIERLSQRKEATGVDTLLQKKPFFLDNDWNILESMLFLVLSRE